MIKVIVNNVSAFKKNNIFSHKMSHYKVFFGKKYLYYSVPTIREYRRTEVFGATLGWAVSGPFHERMMDN